MSRMLLALSIMVGAATGNASVLCGAHPADELSCSATDSVLLETHIGKYVAKDVGTLRIVADNGTKIEFARNNGNASDHAEPQVMAAIEPFHLLLIVVDRGERCERHLVNYAHGAHDRLDGWPLVSPDQQRILIHSEAVESNYCPNRLGIYKVTDGRLEPEFLIDGDSDPASSWGPIEPSWIDARTVQFTRKWYDNSVERNRPITLRLDAAGWREVEQPSQPVHVDIGQVPETDHGNP